MNDIKTTKQLLELLQGGSQEEQEEIKANLRYVLYARKSTTDDERQERSIPDQIEDCMQASVRPNSLDVREVIEEKYSAKEPDVRPKFREMINGIKSGKYDGIVAWHPDRLSRNMKEAGEIIDLLDKGVLKDLQFATSKFENNPTGKMLLGISFVLSKQYSEHLSESVARGNKRITESGEYIGQLKHGYFITKDRKLFPDGENFLIVQRAFQRRLEGQSMPEIMTWLNMSGYMVRRWQKNPETFQWDKDAVHKMLKDPLYAGVLRYGKNLVDLGELYDFTPAISVEDFMKINKVSKLSSPKLVSSMTAKSKKSVMANFMRGKVTCGYCEKPMTSSLTSKTIKDLGKIRYYYFKCETLNCEFRNKNVRAEVIITYVIKFLEYYQFTTKENYEGFIKDAKVRLAENLKLLDAKIASSERTIAVKRKGYEQAKELLKSDPKLKKHYDLDALQKEVGNLLSKKEDLLRERREAKDVLPTYKKYLELLKDTSDYLLNEDDYGMKDALVRFFFSNFTLKDRSVSVAILKEPWIGFLESNNFVRGRPPARLLQA